MRHNIPNTFKDQAFTFEACLIIIAAFMLMLSIWLLITGASTAIAAFKLLLSLIALIIAVTAIIKVF